MTLTRDHLSSISSIIPLSPELLPKAIKLHAYAIEQPMSSPMDPMDLAHHASMIPSRETHRDIRGSDRSVVPATISPTSSVAMDPRGMMHMMYAMCQQLMRDPRPEESMLLPMQPRPKPCMNMLSPPPKRTFPTSPPPNSTDIEVAYRTPASFSRSGSSMSGWSEGIGAGDSQMHVHGTQESVDIVASEEADDEVLHLEQQLVLASKAAQTRTKKAKKDLGISDEGDPVVEPPPHKKKKGQGAGLCGDLNLR